MSAATVSAAYLLGISEGRAMLNRFKADGIADAHTIRAHLANIRAAKGQSGTMAEAARAERDFFRNQLAKFEGGRA